MDPGWRPAILSAKPEALAGFIAFAAEHQRGGELEGGLEGGLCHVDLYLWSRDRSPGGAITAADVLASDMRRVVFAP